MKIEYGVTSKNYKYMALFGNAGDFDDETDEDEEREYDLALHGLDPDELADMDEDDRSRYNYAG